MDNSRTIENINRREKKEDPEDTDINDLIKELPKQIENQNISVQQPGDIESNLFPEFENDNICQDNIINEMIISLKDERNELKKEIQKSNNKIEQIENHLNELRIQLEEQEKEILELGSKNKRQEVELIFLSDLKINQETIITELMKNNKMLKEDLDTRKIEKEEDIIALKEKIKIQKNMLKDEIHQEIKIRNLKNDNERQNEELIRLREVINEKEMETFRLKNENESINLLRCTLEKETIDLRNDNKRQKRNFELIKMEKDNKEKEMTELRTDCDQKEKQLSDLMIYLKEKEEKIINLKNENATQNKELYQLRISKDNQEKEIKELSNKIEKNVELNLLSDCKEKENDEIINLRNTMKKQSKSLLRNKKKPKEEQQNKHLSDFITPPTPTSFEGLQRLKLLDLIATHSWEIFDISSIKAMGIIIDGDNFSSTDGNYRICLALNSNGCSVHYNKHFCVELYIGNNPKGSRTVWPLNCAIAINLKNKSNIRSLEILTENKFLQEPNNHDPIIFHFTKIDINQTNLFPENSILIECNLYKIIN